MKEKKYSMKQIICILACINFGASFFYPIPAGMEDNGMTAIAIIILAVVAWMADVVPLTIALVGMMIIFVVCGITTMTETAGSLGSDTVWLIIAMLVIGEVVVQTYLPKRMAYKMLSLCKGNVYLAFLALMVFCFLLSFFIPSTVGKALLVFPICIEVGNIFKEHELGELQNVIVPAVLFIATIGAFCVMTGSPTTFAAVELFRQQLDYHWTYFGWIKAFFPIGFFAMLLFWALLCLIYFPRKCPRIQLELATKDEEGIGKLSLNEKKVIILYVILFILWGTKSMTGIPMATSACLMMCALFLPKVEIISWKQCMSTIDWGIPLLMTAGLSIAVAMENSGITHCITEWMKSSLALLPSGMIIVVIILVVLTTRLVFVNNVMMTAIFLPIIFSTATALHFNPLWLGMFVLQLIDVGMFLPTQSVESIAVFSYGTYTMKMHFKVGALLAVILVTLILACGFFYWPLLGYSLV